MVDGTGFLSLPKIGKNIPFFTLLPERFIKAYALLHVELCKDNRLKDEHGVEFVPTSDGWQNGRLVASLQAGDQAILFMYEPTLFLELNPITLHSKRACYVYNVSKKEQIADIYSLL